MSGQHPSPLAPIAFPLANLVATAFLPSSPPASLPSPITPTVGLAGYVALLTTSIRASVLAYVVVLLSGSGKINNLSSR